jgi:CubicO group peptidase (beta-lactamase class C family)
MAPKVDPDAAGLDAKRLERVTEHIQARYIEPQKIAGCQVTVARHGAIGYFRSFGSMDLERGTPMADDAIFRIYSMTKPIAGVALMTLYETGAFQLDDPVHRWIPAWKDLKVREGNELVTPHRPMTVRDTLMHMTGLGWGVESRDMGDFMGAMAKLRGGPTGTLATMCENLAQFPLEFHPGERWLYGVSTDVVGHLVELISGQPFDEYLQEHVFGPLQMEDTGFSVPDSKIDRFTANYGRTRHKTLKAIDDPQSSTYRRPPSFLSGGGGLVSTSADYTRFCQMLVNGGELDGVRVLGRKTVDLMRTNHLPTNTGKPAELRSFAMEGGYGETGFDGIGFGLTMAVGLGEAATQTIGAAGDYYWGGAASTIFWIDPNEDLAVIFMTQLMPSGSFNFRGQLRSTVYPSIID